MRAQRFIPIVPLLITLAACGSSGPGGGGGSGGGSGGSSATTGSTSSTSSGTPGYETTGCYVMTSFSCVESELPSSTVSTAEQGCMSGGGTVVSKCPTDNLVGCCTHQGGSVAQQVDCYYTGGGLDASTGEMSCTQAAGTWSTSH